MSYDQLKSLGIKAEHRSWNKWRIDATILIIMNDGRKFYGWESEDNFHQV